MVMILWMSGLRARRTLLAFETPWLPRPVILPRHNGGQTRRLPRPCSQGGPRMPGGRFVRALQGAPYPLSGMELSLSGSARRAASAGGLASAAMPLTKDQIAEALRGITAPDGADLVG